MSGTYDRIIAAMAPGVEYHQNRFARLLGEFAPAGCHWLDLGAARRIHHGWLGTPQADLVRRAAVVVGCDLSATQMRENPYLRAAAVGDAAQLPFRGASFDLITANMVLEHLPCPAAAFLEVSRLLRPGGRFVFVTPNLRHPVVRAVSLAASARTRQQLALSIERRRKADIFPTWYRANTLPSVRALAGRAGLAAVRLETFSSYPMIRHPAPAVALECLWIRLLELPGLRSIRSNIVGVLAKHPERE